MDDYDIYELFCLMIGKTEDEIDEILEDYSKVEQLIYDEFEIDADHFVKIVEKLVDFCPVVESGLGGDKFKAFVTGGRMIYRKKV